MKNNQLRIGRTNKPAPLQKILISKSIRSYSISKPRNYYQQQVNEIIS